MPNNLTGAHFQVVDTDHDAPSPCTVFVTAMSRSTAKSLLAELFGNLPNITFRPLERTTMFAFLEGTSKSADFQGIPSIIFKINDHIYRVLY